MDYLVNEGYPLAAKNFAKEAKIQSPVEEESIGPRVEIRKAIHSGDIEAAIHKINDYNPEVRKIILEKCCSQFHDYTSFMHHSESSDAVDQTLTLQSSV